MCIRDRGSELSALMESLRQLAQSAGSAQQEAEALQAARLFGRGFAETILGQ